MDKHDIRFAPLLVGGEPFKKRVLAIAQDNYGFMWLGTDEGLYRYDGYTLRPYRHDPKDPRSLSDNTVFVAYKDRAGILWIGTGYGGLDRFDPAQDAFTHYRHDPNDSRSLRIGQVFSICQDRAGSIWIGTSDGLDRLDVASGHFFHYPHPSGNPGTYAIWGLYEDRQGNLLVGCARNLYRLERSSARFSLYSNSPIVPGGLEDQDLQWFAQDRSGEVWFTSPYGRILGALNTMTGEVRRYAFDPEGTRSEHSAVVSRVTKDRNGVVWIGTVGDGLFKFDEEHRSFIRYATEGPDNRTFGQIWALLEDFEGNMWVGSESGVSRFQTAPLQFVNYQHEPHNTNSLSSNDVESVHADARGFLWIGTKGGLQRLDRKTGQMVLYHHDPEDAGSLSHNTVSAIEEDGAGGLWIATMGGGLDRFDRASGRFATYRHNPSDPDSLNIDDLLSVLAEPGGVLWIGTASGLSRFDPATGRFKTFRNDPRDPHSLSDDIVRNLLTDRAGTLWVATNYGLDRFDRPTEHFTVYRHDERDPVSLSNDGITSIYEDRQGTLWIGTRRGLNRFDRARGSFQSFTTLDGLANDYIESIREDNRGNLWLATHEGLSEFSPQTKAVRNYSEADGLPGDYQDPTGAGGRSCVTPEGELVFASDHGVTVFNPSRASVNTFRPPVAVTDFLLFNKPVVPSRDSPLQQPIWATRSLTLNHSQSIFTLEFAALSYVAPQRNRYRYKLEDLEKQWNEVGAERRVATYNSLQPGKYVFRVQGSNDDLVWNETGARLDITVLPPWWATWWLRSIVGLIIAAGIWAVYRARLRQLSVRFEDRLAERTRIAQELHDTLIQEMVAVGLQLDIIEDEINNQQSSVKPTLDVVRNRVRQAISRGRHALLDLRSPTASTNDLVESLSRARMELSTGDVPRFQVFIQGNQRQLHSLIWHELDRIGREAITNAFRHARAKSIEVGLFCSDHDVRLVVRDDGCGMTTNLILKGRREHFGLEGMRERAERAGGRVTVRSRPGHGTEVSVTVPLRRPGKIKSLLMKVVWLQRLDPSTKPSGVMKMN